MTIRSNLPSLPSFMARPGLGFEVKPMALARWDNEIKAASNDDDVISILDIIGSDWFGEGVTTRRVSAALRSIGDKKVTVHINSPGGDFFEGLAIYNLLRAHKKEVTVKVLGIAASAASIIAMAGDRIEVPKAGFLMIHNVWTVVVGDRNDLRDFADVAEEFDRAIAGVYSARSGVEEKAISKMMDKETWLAGESAVEQGFADALLPADEAMKVPDSDEKKPSNSWKKIELLLAQQKVPRAERRRLMTEAFSGKQNAADDDMPGAVVSADVASALASIDIT